MENGGYCDPRPVMYSPGTALELESVLDDDLLDSISNTLSVKTFPAADFGPTRGSGSYVA